MSSRKRILYADDDRDTCKVMATLLGQTGYDVVTAQTAAEALSMAQASRFDLYVVDNHFPDGTGVEVCRQVRALDAGVPFIIYSGTSSEADLEESLRAGAQDYIVKPYVDKLLRKIASLLHRRSG